MIPIAHSAHWLVNVAYLLPFLAFLVWLVLTTVRDRRQADREASEAPDD